MVVGNRRSVNYLETILKRKTWAHGYLFHGPESVGKETAALLFTRSLLCDAMTASFGGCGRCAMCLAPDPRVTNRFFRLQPETVAADESDKEKAKDITIKQVRELRHWLMLASEKNRVVLVDPADKLGGDASNALLKMLEEPSPGTVFILISAFPEYILPTIHSRLVALRFGTVADQELHRIPGSNGELAALSRGRPGIIFSMLKDKTVFHKEAALFESGERVYRGSVADALAVAKKLADDERGRRTIFEHLTAFLRKDMAFLEGKALLESIARAKVASLAFTMLETANVNPRLAVDIMLINLRRPAMTPANEIV